MIASILLMTASAPQQHCTPAAIIERVSPQLFTNPHTQRIRATRLAVHLDANGQVRNITILQSSGVKRLDEAVSYAARRSKYRPAQCNCGAAASTVTFEQNWNK